MRGDERAVRPAAAARAANLYSIRRLEGGYLVADAATVSLSTCATMHAPL